MDRRRSDIDEQIDRKTCRSICDAVGERLEQTLRPDTSRLSPRLEHLMDELRRREAGKQPDQAAIRSHLARSRT